MVEERYARLHEAAERVCAATDPGEEQRLGDALHELAGALAALDRQFYVEHDDLSLSRFAMPDVPDEEADAFLEAVNGPQTVQPQRRCAGDCPYCDSLCVPCDGNCT